MALLAHTVTAPPPPPAATDTNPARSGAHRASAPRDDALPRSVPVEVRVPRIELTARITEVGIATDGSVDLPAEPDDVGWYGGSATPGENGHTVLVGHLDSDTGPAAFYGLGALRRGDRVELTRRDGRTAVFEIDTLTVRPKRGFPSRKVYAPTLGPRLTLITCADWDAEAETYRSNLVVTAHPAD
ncbi:class F sortase [Streptomyces sparsus]